ncbi:hypothetical protein HRG_008181 [Hirsutella rhossiliensis]|uniref:Uncharacterized protein n=1 Tax=Hirsutella rhossiliensis TaxID=111463 RepID=A0A9P8MS99_9HYPO|nr:uncharacterized protein HRG_08181 [Hirsutella rhossiliensis]KAH0961028.1 hypothetical protein HRG_08181 [Hirsutella rhossiliensis]
MRLHLAAISTLAGLTLALPKPSQDATASFDIVKGERGLADFGEDVVAPTSSDDADFIGAEPLTPGQARWDFDRSADDQPVGLEEMPFDEDDLEEMGTAPGGNQPQSPEESAAMLQPAKRNPRGGSKSPVRSNCYRDSDCGKALPYCSEIDAKTRRGWCSRSKY